MERYINISADSVDFDDLDIEGRVSKEDEKRMDQESLANEHKRLLEIKVRVEGDGYGYVFSVTKRENNFRWRCHLCDVIIVGQTHVETHIQSKKHQIKMAVPLHDRQLFTRIEGEEMEAVEINCGEPAPPGFEGAVVKKRGVAQIQAILDCHKASPLIGLEYLVELVPDERDKEPMYVCVLCDKKGDPRVAMAHITSFVHRAKYIGINFPTANRAINSALPRTKEGRRGVIDLVTRICSKIEEKHGRLTPLVLPRDTYENRKEFYNRQIESDRHFRESAEENYMDLVDQDVIRPYNINLDEVPLPTVQQLPAKTEDPKRKITVDRSRLRSHASKENDKKNKKEAESPSNKKPSRSPGHSKPGAPRRSSLSSISNISSSSLSRSPSPVRTRSKSRTPSSSPPLSLSRRRSRSRDRPRRSYTAGRYRKRSRSRSRSRGRYSYRRRSPPRPTVKAEKVKVNSVSAEKLRWEKFRIEKDKIELVLTKTLKFHEKNPEKHPMYPEEWKKFWNIRYKELQAEGKDPSSHDFKPEWISFWNKRMKEMHDETFQEKKEALREKLNLPKEEPQPLQYTHKRVQRPVPDMDDDVIEISPTPTGREMSSKRNRPEANDRKRSLSPWDQDDHYSSKSNRKWVNPRPSYGEPSRPRVKPSYAGPPVNRAPHYVEEQPISGARVVTVIRLLTAMESQLGSIGPTINNLLATSLAMEKSRPGSSESLLGNPDNLVLFETIKEKLKGQLFAGIVEPGMVMATRSSIQNIADMLFRAEGMPATVIAPVAAPVVPKPVPAAQPVTVPGVGAMDKAAIAAQIAAALVAEGRGNVTQEELECLINAVVGMAQQSANLEKPITTAAFVSQMQPRAEPVPAPAPAPTPVPAPAPVHEPAPERLPCVEEKSPLQKLMSVVQSKPLVEEPPKPEVTCLFPSTLPAEELAKKDPPPCKNLSDMDDLTEADLKTLLQSFKDLPTEEQHCLIVYLKKIEETEPERVENLRQFVNLAPTQPVAPPVAEPFRKLGKKKLREMRSAWRRLSPFSLRLSQSNPSHEESYKKQMAEEEENQQKMAKLDDSDDDYSFEDIYEAASKKVNEKETAAKAARDMVAKEEEDAVKKLSLDKLLAELTDLPSSFPGLKSMDTSSIINETNQTIANLMNQLPIKFKRTPTPTNNPKPEAPAKLELPARSSSGLNIDISNNLVDAANNFPHSIPAANASATQPIEIQTTTNQPMAIQTIQQSPNVDQNSMDHMSNSNSNTFDGPLTPSSNLYDGVVPASNIAYVPEYNGVPNYQEQYGQQSFNNPQFSGSGINPGVENLTAYPGYSNVEYTQGFQGNYAENYNNSYYTGPGQQGPAKPRQQANFQQHNFQRANFQQHNFQQQNPASFAQQPVNRGTPNQGFPPFRGNAPQGYNNVYNANQFGQYPNQQQRFYSRSNF